MRRKGSSKIITIFILGFYLFSSVSKKHKTWSNFAFFKNILSFGRTKLYKGYKIIFFTLESFCDFEVNSLVMRYYKAIFEIKDSITYAVLEN